MYEKFYGFLENPFSMTPDPKFFFPSSKHTDALDSLIYTVSERRGLAVITGEIGCGKTTVCRTLLNRLESGTKVTMITNPPPTPQQLLSSILEDLGITFNGETKSNLLSCLKKYLIEQLSLDFNVVLITDEAQNISPEVLEEIRMLSNLETEKKKMIQIILTGQPELKDKLKSRELTQLRQRINVQYHILPLDGADTENYINHRLRVASINGNSQVEFSPEAIDRIYDYSRGIPRIINMLCNNALLIGYVTETKQIPPQIIKEVKEEFGNEVKIDKIVVSQPGEQTRNLTEDLKTQQLLLKEAESQLKQLNEEVKKVEGENSQLKLQLETVFLKLKASQEELNSYESAIAGKLAELDRINKTLESRQKEWEQKQKEISSQIKASQDQLKLCKSATAQKQSGLKELNHNIAQLKEELKNLQAQKHKSQQELLFTKNELNLYQSDIAKKQSELGQINKDLQSSQETLITTQSLVSQKKAELEEQNQKLAVKQSQLQETESRLHQLQKDKEEAQAEQAKLNQLWLERQKEWQTKQEETSRQLQATESQLKQLNEELKKVQEENKELNLKQETVSSQLKSSLSLYESTIAGKQVELGRINKNLQSSQRALNDTESKCQQKHSELEQINTQLDNADKKLKYLKELIVEQTQELTETIGTKGLQLKEIDNNINQLNKELGQIRQEKQKLQAEEERLRQVHLEHQKEWEQKKEELKLCESAVTQKQSGLKELNHNIAQLKEELKNLQEQKIRCQQGQEKLNQLWLDHQLVWHKKEKEILEQFKSTLLNKPCEKPPQADSKDKASNAIDNVETKLHGLEKLASDLTEKPAIKLKAKHPKADAVILTASTSNGKIEINHTGNDDLLNSVYSSIQISHPNRDMANYKNFIFSAKGNRKRDYPAIFRLELKNGTMKIGKHYKVEITDSWQKVNIPLAEFSRITNLNFISEVSLFIDYDIEDTDGLIYINDISFSN